MLKFPQLNDAQMCAPSFRGSAHGPHFGCRGTCTLVSGVQAKGVSVWVLPLNCANLRKWGKGVAVWGVPWGGPWGGFKVSHLRCAYGRLQFTQSDFKTDPAVRTKKSPPARRPGGSCSYPDFFQLDVWPRGDHLGAANDVPDGRRIAKRNWNVEFSNPVVGVSAFVVFDDHPSGGGVRRHR